MKKITLLFAALLSVAYIAVAQQKLYVYQNDGTRTEFVVSTVDSIAFSTITDSPDQPDDPIKPVDPTNGHEYVDLGLPSRTKWATMNVGADSPEDYGDYFAWGETTTKSTYNWSTYKWCKVSDFDEIMTKYCTSSLYGTVDNKTTLDLSDDAAYVNWGSSWRMPTKAEQDELRNTNYTTWAWTTQNGVKGYKVTSKTNGNSIFLPAAGERYDSDLNYAGSYGYYRSSSLHTDVSVFDYYLDFNSDDVGSYHYFRYYGLSVRPVLRDVELSYNTIFFDANGGTGTMSAMSYEKGETKVLTANKFTRTGYIFKGWNTKADGTGTSYSDKQSITPTENLYLYAQWAIAKKLYYVNLYNWDIVNIYVWGSGVGYLAAWPGVSANKEDFTINGYEVYSYDMTGLEEYDNVIFNGKLVEEIYLDQTKDLTIDYSTPYYSYNAWYASIDEIPLVGVHNGHEYVDLGLPSGTKWATMNVGADSPEDYGDYFAWGETYTKSIYTSSVYNDPSNPTTLPLDRDAAYVNWGGSWRMPTRVELNELSNFSYTTWTSTTQNGVNGYKVTSKANGNSIFFPAAGYRRHSVLYSAGSCGYYWSSSLSTNDSDCAYYLNLYSGDEDISLRYDGQSVRPVLAK